MKRREASAILILLGVALIVSVVSGCGEWSTVYKTPDLIVPRDSNYATAASSEGVYIRESLAPCLSTKDQLCLVAEDASGNPNLYINNIDGFTFRWGHRYVLMVGKIGDGHYVLLNQVADSLIPIGTEFSLPLTDRMAQSELPDQCLFSTEGQQFVATQKSTCTQAQQFLASDSGFNAVFQFTGLVGQPLVLQSVHRPVQTSWQSVRVVDQDAYGRTLSRSCNEIAFTVQSSDGSYQYLTCDNGTTVGQGKLAPTELSELTQDSNQIMATGLYQQNCNSTLPQPMSHQVFMTFDNGDVFNLLQSSPGGTCYRGDSQEAQTFDSDLRKLRDQYMPVHAMSNPPPRAFPINPWGAQAQSGATPIPLPPLPTPTPAPTPTPVQSPALPMPTPGPTPTPILFPSSTPFMTPSPAPHR